MNAYELKNKALAVLKKRRQDAIANLNDRIDDLCKNNEFNEAYFAEREAEVELEKAKFFKKDLAVFLRKLKTARQVTDLVLAKLGKTREYLSVSYFCDKCSDTGLINGKYCSCVEELQTRLAYDGRQSTPRFDFSQSVEKDEGNKKVIKKAQEWCENFGKASNAKTNFLISGHSGVGKTFLTDCMVNALRSQKINVVYLTAYNLNKMFFDDFMSAEKYLLDNLTKVQVLAIDDLGKEPTYNKVSLESLYCLLNERLLNGKSTVINTNLDFKGLIDRYGEPIFSRIANKQTTTVVEIKGADKRLS